MFRPVVRNSAAQVVSICFVLDAKDKYFTYVSIFCYSSLIILLSDFISLYKKSKKFEIQGHTRGAYNVWEFKQPRQLQQIKHHSKINIDAMVNIAFVEKIHSTWTGRSPI